MVILEVNISEFLKKSGYLAAFLLLITGPNVIKVKITQGSLYFILEYVLISDT